MAEKEIKGIKKFLEEFKAFAMRGNVLDMAVGVVIGGAFTAIAEYVLEGGGVVFGAALDNHLRVSHIAVKNLHDLPRLRGSKPVQSDVGESYQQVRLYLDQGRQVLFSGTPSCVKRQVWKICRFSRPVNNLSVCYVQISAATVYTAL